MDFEDKTLAIPPGATIKEQMVDLGMTQKELSLRLGYSQKHISQLINGEVQLTQEMAARLEMVLGVPARFWNKLEAIYRENLHAARLEEDLSSDMRLAEGYPYDEMAASGWVPKTTLPIERTYNLRKHFEVSNLALMEDESLSPRVVCRPVGEKRDALGFRSWIQRARKLGRRVDVGKKSAVRLMRNLMTIRIMTKEDIHEVAEELGDVLATCGIALVLVPPIAGIDLSAATIVDGKKVIVSLADKDDSADMWLALFHEIGHIACGHLDKTEVTAEEEQGAEEFAREALVPRCKLDEFAVAGGNGDRAVDALSCELGVGTEIVRRLLALG